MVGLCCFGGGRFGTVGLPIWQLILCAVPTKGVRRRTVPSAFRWFMCMWPGLSVAWYSGSFRGLAVALLFVLGLQTAWVATFIWPALLTAWDFGGPWRFRFLDRWCIRPGPSLGSQTVDLMGVQMRHCGKRRLCTYREVISRLRNC
jgi:hypothetical protein